MALAEQCAPEKMRGSLDILCFQTHRTLQHLDALAKPKIGSVLPRTNAPYCTVPCGGSCARGKTDMFMNTARYHESEERLKISRVKQGSHRFKLNTNSGGLRRARDVAGIASLPEASAKHVRFGPHVLAREPDANILARPRSERRAQIYQDSESQDLIMRLHREPRPSEQPSSAPLLSKSTSVYTSLPMRHRRLSMSTYTEIPFLAYSSPKHHSL